MKEENERKENEEKKMKKKKKYNMMEAVPLERERRESLIQYTIVITVEEVERLERLERREEGRRPWKEERRRGELLRMPG